MHPLVRCTTSRIAKATRQRDNKYETIALCTDHRDIRLSSDCSCPSRVGREVAHPGVMNEYDSFQEKKYYTYYQWVCFVLFFQERLLGSLRAHAHVTLLIYLFLENLRNQERPAGGPARARPRRSSTPGPRDAHVLRAVQTRSLAGVPTAGDVRAWNDD
ncbi:Innexin inx1 [Eumeta japonica]|uniref:Innexin inx1 n=1 Tax=Eumeta variegata TaxID=151549 RepID=A0A4C1TT87_EUMVA|nr:Innexin inx1 [Eumeta japonica]